MIDWLTLSCANIRCDSLSFVCVKMDGMGGGLMVLIAIDYE